MLLYQNIKLVAYKQQKYLLLTFLEAGSLEGHIHSIITSNHADECLTYHFYFIHMKTKAEHFVN